MSLYPNLVQATYVGADALTLEKAVAAPIEQQMTGVAKWLRRFETGVFSQIGLVMIIGLAATNAILIVEFSKAQHERGAPLLDAALAGARLRLRPILMTAFAFILGVVPLVIATGSGAASRQILGTTVLGGMLAATAIVIFIIPATFYVSQRVGRRADTPGRLPGSRPTGPAAGTAAEGASP